MAHPLRSGTSLISADMYLPACSHTCVRAKHGRSDSSSRPRSRRAVPAPILTAAAAFDSFVSTNTWTDRRLPLCPPNNAAGQAVKCGCRTRRKCTRLEARSCHSARGDGIGVRSSLGGVREITRHLECRPPHRSSQAAVALLGQPDRGSLGECRPSLL